MSWTVKCRWRLTVYNAYFQFKMLLSILSSLLEKTKYSLTRIRRIFPAENSPKDGVPALVALYELTLESARQLQSEFPSVFSVLLQARVFANNLTTKSMRDLLASYLEVIYTHVLRLNNLRSGVLTLFFAAVRNAWYNYLTIRLPPPNWNICQQECRRCHLTITRSRFARHEQREFTCSAV